MPTDLARLLMAAIRLRGSLPEISVHDGIAVGSGENAKAFRGKHEFQERMGLELLHGALAVRLHRALGDVELMRDLLVQPAVHDPLKHLMLARRQLLQQRTQRSALAIAPLTVLLTRDRPLDRRKKQVSGHRLDQEVLGAGLDGAHAHGNVGMAGREDDRQARGAVDQALLQLRPAHSRQSDVENDTAGRRQRQPLQQIGRSRVAEYLVAGRAQLASDRRPERGIVVDDVDGSSGHVALPLSAETRGRLRLKTAPPPGRCSAQMRPWWASTIVRAIDSPMPMPCSLVVKNGSNTRASPSAGIPWPKSMIDTMTDLPLPASVRPMIRRRSFGCCSAASIAFMARLRTTCSS